MNLLVAGSIGFHPTKYYKSIFGLLIGKIFDKDEFF